MRSQTAALVVCTNGTSRGTYNDSTSLHRRYPREAIAEEGLCRTRTPTEARQRTNFSWAAMLVAALPASSAMLDRGKGRPLSRCQPQSPRAAVSHRHTALHHAKGETGVPSKSSRTISEVQTKPPKMQTFERVTASSKKASEIEI